MVAVSLIKFSNYIKELFEHGANSKSYTEPLFKIYNILKVDDNFKYKLLTFY